MAARFGCAHRGPFMTQMSAAGWAINVLQPLAAGKPCRPPEKIACIPDAERMHDLEWNVIPVRFEAAPVF
ncbi:hypothetical protein ERN12_15485 [Rhodobacteraceae bacterium]|nr:hypothetical protein ERN12_15485 [Paracoccaceae bacterium]